MADALSFEAFADWCEKQPASQQYEYNSQVVCACAQYAQSIGQSSPYGDDVDAPIRTKPFWRKADDEAFRRPRTFDALAARLREASKAEVS